MIDDRPAKCEPEWCEPTATVECDDVETLTPGVRTAIGVWPKHFGHLEDQDRNTWPTEQSRHHQRCAGPKRRVVDKSGASYDARVWSNHQGGRVFLRDASHHTHVLDQYERGAERHGVGARQAIALAVSISARSFATPGPNASFKPAR